MTASNRTKMILIGVGVVLSIPLIAMQFSSAVDWGVFDFIIAGALLLGTGLGIDLAIRKIRNKEQRLAVIAVLLVALFLIWAELAVGLFGSPIAGS